LGVNDILDIAWFNRPDSMMDSWVAVIGTMAIKWNFNVITKGNLLVK
jgi:hypothetical protein